MKEDLRQQGKSMFLRITEGILRVMARTVLWRHKPIIIGVTGSIGKTSTKDAIAHILTDDFSVFATQKNYNNEIGLPLTILMSETAGRSLIGWFSIFVRWMRLFIGGTYPHVLVLEYGIDRPGDMDALNHIAKPDIAVITHISSVHQEFFNNVAHIAREKRKLARAVECSYSNDTPCGVVLNNDDPLVRSMQKGLRPPLYTYGTKDGAMLQADHITLLQANQLIDGLSFKINGAGKSVPIRLPKVVAEHHVYVVLAAVAVAHFFKMNLVQIAERLVSYEPPVGRMRLIVGKHDIRIIDDSYNASPKATLAAIATLASLQATRRIVILGDMLELGNASDRAHDDVISAVCDAGVACAIFVGTRMREAIVRRRAKIEVSDMVVIIADRPMDVLQQAEDVLQRGDTVLVKGSQGMRMEKIVEHLAHADVVIAKELCRQDTAWREKLFVLP